MTYLLIAIGSALGGMARYWSSAAIALRLAPTAPWLGTVAVNVIGAFLIGAAFGVLEPGGRFTISASLRDFINQFFMVGVLGGFTTFSAFSLQTFSLLREEQWLLAGANVFLSLGLCLVAVWLGFTAAVALTR